MVDIGQDSTGVAEEGLVKRQIRRWAENLQLVGILKDAAPHPLIEYAENCRRCVALDIANRITGRKNEGKMTRQTG